MTLVRWTPESEYTGVQRHFTPMLNPITPYPITSIEQPFFATVPPVDLIDQNNEFVVKAEVPGVDPGNLKIMVANNVLTIRGDRLQEREARDDNYFWTERSTGAFQRSINLPVTVEPSEVSAYCDNGILTIRLPKSRESASVQVGIQSSFGKSTAARSGQTTKGNGSKRNRTRNH